MTNIPSAISAAMKMEGSYVASVVLTGLAVVFLALLLLIIVFKIFGVVFSRKPKAKPAKRHKAENAKPQSVSKATSESSKPVSTPVQSANPPVIEEGIDLEVIAVITAAIAAMSASSGKKMRLASVKTSGASRRAWAQAGINDNTRPF